MNVATERVIRASCERIVTQKRQHPPDQGMSTLRHPPTLTLAAHYFMRR